MYYSLFGKANQVKVGLGRKVQEKAGDVNARSEVGRVRRRVKFTAAFFGAGPVTIEYAAKAKQGLPPL